MSRSESTHHRGPLAGLGAGAVAVLVLGLMVLVAGRSQLSSLVTVVAWSLKAAAVGAVIAAAVYAFLWLRHRVEHPETLAGRRAFRAEVLDEQAAPMPAIPAGQPAAIEPPREVHLHFHGASHDEAAHVIRQALTVPAQEEIPS